MNNPPTSSPGAAPLPPHDANFPSANHSPPSSTNPAPPNQNVPHQTLPISEQNLAEPGEGNENSGNNNNEKADVGENGIDKPVGNDLLVAFAMGCLIGTFFGVFGFFVYCCADSLGIQGRRGLVFGWGLVATALLQLFVVGIWIIIYFLN